MNHGKHRYLNTRFWDDGWIRSLPLERRYLYLYLILNPMTNIAGIYEITPDRMAFDTGISEAEVRESLRVFEAKEKVFMIDSWLIVRTWPRYQNLVSAKGKETNIKLGIDRILLDLPEHVFNYVVKVKYDYKFMVNIIKTRG